MESRINAAIKAFQDAGVGASSWAAALHRLAEATGSRSGQLIGIGRDWATPFNWITETPPEALHQFAAIRGHDPEINSRVRIGASGPELAVYDERHFTTEEDCRRNPAYGELLERYDIPYLCLTTLLRRDGVLVGLVVNRGRTEGQITDEQRRAFEAIAPHARAAVRTQLALQAQGPLIAAGALAAAQVAAFICDSGGRVRDMTAEAESLARQGDPLSLRNGRLAAADAGEAAVLSRAIALAVGRMLTAPRDELILLGVRRDQPLRVQVAPLTFGRASFGPEFAVVTAQTIPSQSPSEAVLRLRHRLTPAEGKVADGLLQGLRPRVIADQLGISEATVRTHVRNILAKAEVRSVVEFIARS